MNQGKIWLYHPNFTTIYHFWEERVAKIYIKSSCWRLKGGRQILKSVPDTNFMNLGQIAHKLWLLSLFYHIYHFGE